MTRDCSTCICKEGSCYPSLTIFDKDKTCKSYEPDYEGYIADLERKNAELKSVLVKKADINHSLVEQMAKLESENAELKEQNEKLKCCENCKGVCSSDDVAYFCKNNGYKLWEIKE